MLIQQILSSKGTDVSTIAPDLTVEDALTQLVDQHIGSLMVQGEEGEMLGIITERDILRLTHENPGVFRKVAVSEVMTKELVIGAPTDSVNRVMGLMTKHRVRHLPIVDDGKLVGLISIGDVVKAQLLEVNSENEQLRDYILGP